MFGEPGFFGARLGRYLADRARGGAGVIIAGQAQVHPTTAYQMPNNACAWRPEAVPHFRAVTDAVHAHGALAFLQLAHNGGVNQGPWSKLPAWAPSAVANSLEPPKPMEAADIAAVIDGFADSARHAAAGGFDGIELHAAHGYLIHEFLSPRSNRRTDDYGGSLENRMRFDRRGAGGGARRGRAARRRRPAPGRRRGDRRGGLTADDAAEIAAAPRGRAAWSTSSTSASASPASAWCGRCTCRTPSPRTRRAPSRRAVRAHAGLRRAPHPDARRRPRRSWRAATPTR